MAEKINCEKRQENNTELPLSMPATPLILEWMKVNPFPNYYGSKETK